MVIRIQRPITKEALESLNDRFANMLSVEKIEQVGPLPEESDDVHLQNLPRLVLTPHKREFGQFRLLLNAINESAVVGDLS